MVVHKKVIRETGKEKVLEISWCTAYRADPCDVEILSQTHFLIFLLLLFISVAKTFISVPARTQNILLIKQYANNRNPTVWSRLKC